MMERNSSKIVSLNDTVNGNARSADGARAARGSRAWGRLLGAAAVLASLAAGGCVKSMIPGDLARVQTFSDAPRAGNVYLLRGWIGIFSYGIDGIGRETNESGVRASVFQDDQWYTLAQSIRAKYKGVKDPEPLVLIGHSYGADDVINVARELKKDDIAVDLLVTLDPVTPHQVPSNVRWCYNLFQSNGFMDNLPFLRGIAVVGETPFPGKLDNVDIRKDRTDLLEAGTDHFNIEKKMKIHGEIQVVVRKVCPPRQDWARSHASRETYATAGGVTPKMASSSGAAQQSARSVNAAARPAPPTTRPASRGSAADTRASQDAVLPF